MRQSEALQAYARAVRYVQEAIASCRLIDDPSALWVTFFLGVFEVCTALRGQRLYAQLADHTGQSQLLRDPTGTNWLSHFLHGTSTMLRLLGPKILTCSSPSNVSRRAFFLGTRIFEISRSLIFSSYTFLSTPEWTEALKTFWDGEGASLWHPKEALFDTIPLISELSVRTIRFCNDVQDMSVYTQVTLAKSLGKEGFVLQEALQQWWLVATAWESAYGDGVAFGSVLPKVDTDSLIGQIYYHAVNIYLSGTYDYHRHWTCVDAPILSREMIDWHVKEILRISHELLAQGVAGVLLFFPLRVAGARATDPDSRSTIIEVLRTTKRRGFVVAEAFVTDLLDLWSKKGWRDGDVMPRGAT